MGREACVLRRRGAERSGVARPSGARAAVPRVGDKNGAQRGSVQALERASAERSGVARPSGARAAVPRVGDKNGAQRGNVGAFKRSRTGSRCAPCGRCPRQIRLSKAGERCTALLNLAFPPSSIPYWHALRGGSSADRFRLRQRGRNALFAPHFRLRRKCGAKNNKSTALPKAKRPTDQSNA